VLSIAFESGKRNLDQAWEWNRAFTAFDGFRKSNVVLPQLERFSLQ